MHFALAGAAVDVRGRNVDNLSPSAEHSGKQQLKMQLRSEADKNGHAEFLAIEASLHCRAAHKNVIETRDVDDLRRFLASTEMGILMPRCAWCDSAAKDGHLQTVALRCIGQACQRWASMSAICIPYAHLHQHTRCKSLGLMSMTKRGEWHLNSIASVNEKPK